MEYGDGEMDDGMTGGERVMKRKRERQGEMESERDAHTHPDRDKDISRQFKNSVLLLSQCRYFALILVSRD